ncbi:MFS transporter [Micromonospora sp. NBC_01813]|uniref:MFS transporter n=1 Tax=Micromonospora sp. NBC_01813 TaxID=2975988 RepID=UPI002DDA6573|nr:MFS transporter [Micromonospora sp. NBC_01813]WSA06512.1 MFS transporter [Micromonospora sp. NBC_01813]
MTATTSANASTSVPPAQPGGTGRSPYRRAWWIVAALAVTQTVGYGTLYYSFPVFLPAVAASLGVTQLQATGAFTASVLAGAVLAVPVGRWLDRHGGRGSMTVGSIAGTLLLVGFSQVDTLIGLYLVWTGIGAVGALVLYESAFAVVVSWFDAARRSTALLAVTLVAGFASTIFLPVTGLLVDRYGWRVAALILAAVHGALTVPLHVAVIRHPPYAGTVRPAIRPAAQTGRARSWRRSAAPPRVPDPGRAALRRAVRDRRFWLLATAFVAHAAGLATVTIHLVSYLQYVGHSAKFAASLAGLLGVLSVAGRIMVTALQRWQAPTTVTAGVFALQAVAAGVLPAVAAGVPGAIAGIVCFGLGFGVATIARPTLLSELFGTTGFATISAVLVVPITLVTALAPLGAALLREATGSYPVVWAAVAACCVVAALAVAAVGRPTTGAAAGPDRI